MSNIELTFADRAEDVGAIIRTSETDGATEVGVAAAELRAAGDSRRLVRRAGIVAIGVGAACAIGLPGAVAGPPAQFATAGSGWTCQQHSADAHGYSHARGHRDCGYHSRATGGLTLAGGGGLTVTLAGAQGGSSARTSPGSTATSSATTNLHIAVPEAATAPGNGGTPPGHGGTPPGLRAAPPGHGGPNPGKAKQSSGPRSATHGKKVGQQAKRGAQGAQVDRATARASTPPQMASSSSRSNPSAATRVGTAASGSPTPPLPTHAPQGALLHTTATPHAPATPATPRPRSGTVVDALPPPQRPADVTWLLSGVVAALAAGVFGVVVASGRRGRRGH